MSENKPANVCRVCIGSCEKESSSIFGKYKEFIIFDYINSITKLDIKKDDGLPDEICGMCFTEFETVVHFKEKCLKANQILHTTMLNSKIEDDSGIHDSKFKLEPNDNEIKLEALDECFLETIVDDSFLFGSDQECLKDETPKKSRAINLNLECHDCGGLFKSKCKLRVHWKRTHMFTSLICPTCKRKFKSYVAYHRHMKRNQKSCRVAGNSMVRIEGEGKSRVFYCKECNYRSHRIKDIQTHIVIHNGDRPFQCDECPSRYTQQSSLQSHKETAHKKYVVEITCHFCGKYLKGRNRVYRHLKTHTGDRIPCAVCKKMLQKSSYKTHMQRHSGIKSFTCEICASTFYTNAELCNHKRVVHDKKAIKCHKCEFCDYQSARTDLLKKHQSRHNSSNIPCTVCGMFFLTPQKLQMHQRVHFEEKKHKCTLCEKGFFKRDSLRRHRKNHHKCLYLDDQKTVTVKLESSTAINVHDEVVEIEIKKPVFS